MCRTIAVAGLLLACAVLPAMADYWVQYQPLPDAPYPEDQGWERITAYGGAQRSIQDGALVLDSAGSPGIVDFYRMDSPGMIHAEPTHPFSMEIRLSVDYANDADVGFGLFSDDRWAVAFGVSADRVYSRYEYPKSVPVTPGYHIYQVMSPDMRTYTLSIDGMETMSGPFTYRDWFIPSRVYWGDESQGPVSFSRWSGTGFGVTPEPAAALTVSIALTPILRMLRRR